ncbi:retrovirus-related pol polyprotein from transposon TNT 1-94 [Tanacetum coccineum]
MVRAGHAAYTDRFHELASLVPYLISGALTDEAVRNGSIKKVENRGNVGGPSKDRNRRDDNKRTRTMNAFATTVNPVGRGNTELQTYKATMESSEAPYWKEAIQSEIDSIIDVKTAFLNGELDEEIYMQQPEGFVVKCQEHKICKLVKSLYDLKQALKQWHEKFDNTLLSNAFHINECDKCVYVKQYKNAFVIICLYVDDMLIMGTNMDVINQTKKMLHSSFDVKDMGEADVILGIRIQNNSNGYILTQSHYIENTLKKFGHYDDRPVVTPFDPKVQLKKNKGQSVSQLHYTQVLGSLMYIMNCTRPDLAYSVSRLRRYSHNPVLEGYCDANWISNYNEGKSTSGYVFTLGGAVVSWKLSKQTVNTSSTMEA